MELRRQVYRSMPDSKAFADRSSILSGSQYKYQFNKKWGWKKNVPASTKANIVQKGQKRASMGKSTVAMYKGNRIDSKKLRRHAKEISRREGAGTFVAKGQAEQIFDDPETQITSVLPHKDTVSLSAFRPLRNSSNVPQVCEVDFALPKYAIRLPFRGRLPFSPRANSFDANGCRYQDSLCD